MCCGATEPIPGVNVSVTQDSESIASAKTNDVGEFRFDSLKEGAYEVPSGTDMVLPVELPSPKRSSSLGLCTGSGRTATRSALSGDGPQR